MPPPATPPPPQELRLKELFGVWTILMENKRIPVFQEIKIKFEAKFCASAKIWHKF